MRLNRVDKDARIVELYKRGWSFRQLQKHYHRSPNNIAQLVGALTFSPSVGLVGYQCVLKRHHLKPLTLIA